GLPPGWVFRFDVQDSRRTPLQRLPHLLATGTATGPSRNRQSATPATTPLCNIVSPAPS
ncbi:hypothetical protein NDU88_007008, partial [Pleurodeles waltl]